MSKGILKTIFKNHWSEFVELYGHRIRKNVYSEVEKMLNCGSIENGYIEFKCEACGESKKVGFKCKSRFCTSCGKIYVDNWVEDMVARLYRTKHRHMVFTIPKELREYFQRDRKLLKLLPEGAADVLKRWYKNMNKKEEFTPGIITVIHTFGRDLKWNPHVHVLVTDGGAGNNVVWRPISFIPYEMLRKSWQKVILDKLLLSFPGKRKEIKLLKDRLYKKLESGFYVYAKGEIKTAEQAGRYVGRYTGRPAIAESRIIKYDGRKVTFYYERHEDGKRVEEVLDVLDFIAKVIIHIPEKHFKMIRYYGIYARNNRYKERKFYKFINEKVAEELKKLRKWRFRILKHIGIDPLKCEKCGTQMVIFDVVYKGKSTLEGIRKRLEYQVKNNINDFMNQYEMIKEISYDKIEPLFV